jgi:hypothetical protein
VECTGEGVMPLSLFVVRIASVMRADPPVRVSSGGPGVDSTRPLRTNHESIRGVCQKTLWLESESDSISMSCVAETRHIRMIARSGS